MPRRPGLFQWSRLELGSSERYPRPSNCYTVFNYLGLCVSACFHPTTLQTSLRLRFTAGNGSTGQRVSGSDGSLFRTGCMGHWSMLVGPWLTFRQFQWCWRDRKINCYEWDVLLTVPRPLRVKQFTVSRLIQRCKMLSVCVLVRLRQIMTIIIFIIFVWFIRKTYECIYWMLCYFCHRHGPITNTAIIG